jgi:hypothetical protein
MMNPEKRISFKNAIVSNCFNIMETFLASNQGCRNENIPRKNENEYQR